MKNIILKQVINDDWKLVLEFEKNANSDVFYAYESEGDVKEYIKNSKVFFIILNEEKIGTISYEEKESNTLHFNGLIVSDEYRGQGIGLLAIKKLFENISDNKIIDLVVHPKNIPAVIIYLKAGFKIEGWKNNFFGDGEDRLYLVRTNLYI
ncbi:MAG: GNAT family N-acetyltransferase [Candidatus Gracilibacteria bacterium]